MLLNILLIFIIIVQIVLLSIFLNKYPSEGFAQGWGASFGEFVNPVPPCRDENDCSRGHPARWTYYENMCEPITFNSELRFLEPGRGLLKTKRDLRNSCLRTL